MKKKNANRKHAKIQLCAILSPAILNLRICQQLFQRYRCKRDSEKSFFGVGSLMWQHLLLQSHARAPTFRNTAQNS